MDPVISVHALEALMCEFFSAGTSNARQREIEATLEQLARQPDAWRRCVACIAATHNPYLTMYCMNTLQTVVRRRWWCLSPQHRSELRAALWQLCVQRRGQLPSYLRNKAAQLVVDVARQCWPQDYPSFYADALQLASRAETAGVGVLLLLTAGEEFFASRDDTSAARRTELKTLMLAQLPATVAVLAGILRSVLETNKAHSTATPPPSPEQPRVQRRPGGANTNYLSPSASSGSLLSTMLTSDGGDKNPFCSVLPLDGTTTELVSLTLRCLSQLFAWAPLNAALSAGLLTDIFHFVSLGFSQLGDDGAEAGDAAAAADGAAVGSDEPLAITAVSCINEIVSKNWLPGEGELYLLQLFRHTFHLLQRLLEASSRHAEPLLSGVHPDYLSGLTEFLRLFVTLHLRRLESQPQFPVLDLLALLFRYTFLQPEREQYLACLEIWCTFLDHLSSKCSGLSHAGDTPTLATKYREAVVSLAGQSLQRLQLRQHAARLRPLLDSCETEQPERTEQAEETEWEQLLRRSAELLERAASLYPADVRSLLSSGWQETLSVYVSIPSLLEPAAAGSARRRLRLPCEADAARLEHSVRDLSTHLFLLGRLTPLLTESSGPDPGPLLQQLVGAASFGSTHRLYEAEPCLCGGGGGGETPRPLRHLRAALTELHAQSLAALRPWCHWIVAAQAGAVHTGAQVDELLQELTVAVCGAVQSTSPRRLCAAAVATLVTITSVVRSGALVDCPQIQQLYGRAGSLTLGKLERRRLYRALSALLLLPWLRAADQLWEERRRHLAVFLGSLTAEFRRLRQLPGLAGSAELKLRAAAVIERTLPVLAEIVSSVSAEISRSRQLCYQCLQDAIHDALWIFPIVVEQPEPCQEVLGFFLAAFESLRAQMGGQFTEQCVQLFINVFSRPDLASSLLHEGSAGGAALARFLRLLRLIVSEPSAAFRRLLPDLLTLHCQQLTPLLTADEAPAELRAAAHQLTGAVLEHNWRYFFPSSVLRALTGEGGDGAAALQDVAPQHADRLLQLLQSLGQSFTQADLTVYRLNLHTLHTLNNKWCLYRRPVFAARLLDRFVTVLVGTLLARSHDLLRDEITAAVHALAGVDWPRFCHRLVPTLLREAAELTDAQRATLLAQLQRPADQLADLPSFSAALAGFISDWRHCSIANQPL